MTGCTITLWRFNLVMECITVLPRLNIMMLYETMLQVLTPAMEYSINSHKYIKINPRCLILKWLHRKKRKNCFRHSSDQNCLRCSNSCPVKERKKNKPPNLLHQQSFGSIKFSITSEHSASREAISLQMQPTRICACD